MTQTCTCGKPTSGAWLCDHCAKTLAYAIANVAAHYDDLETLATKRARYGSQGSTKGSIGKAQPLPVDIRFVERLGDGSRLRWDAENTISTWCRVIMEDQPELRGPVCSNCLHVSCATIRRRRSPRNTVRSMCAYLDRQWRWLLREQWAPELLDELLDLERRLTRMIDRPADKWYAGKCSAPTDEGETAHCETELYAAFDSGTTTCQGCGATHDIASRRTFLLAEAKDYLVTATEAAGALLAWTEYDGSETKLVDLVRKWRDADKLEVQDVTSLLGKDRHLYRLGDIQELLVIHAQRAQSRRLRTA